MRTRKLALLVSGALAMIFPTSAWAGDETPSEPIPADAVYRAAASSCAISNADAKCSATIIGRYHLLTAAHCASILDGGEFGLRCTGRPYVERRKGRAAVRHQAARELSDAIDRLDGALGEVESAIAKVQDPRKLPKGIHARLDALWEERGFHLLELARVDVALITTDTPLPAPAIGLARPEEIPGLLRSGQCAAAGWGRRFQGDPFANIVDPRRRPLTGIGSATLDLEGEYLPGDSGGGLLCLDPAGEWQLVGVTSLAADEEMGVGTNAGAHRQWLRGRLLGSDPGLAREAATAVLGEHLGRKLELEGRRGKLSAAEEKKLGEHQAQALRALDALIWESRRPAPSLPAL